MDESGSENIKDHAKLAEYKEEIAQLISQINIFDDNLRANGIVLFFFRRNFEYSKLLPLAGSAQRKAG